MPVVVTFVTSIHFGLLLFIISNWKLDLQAAQHVAKRVQRLYGFHFLVMFNRWQI